MSLRIPAIALFAAGLLLSGAASSFGSAQDLTFPIHRFDVSGNTLLPEARLSALVDPFTGLKQSFADVQLALESLERAYRDLGYSAVAIQLPEQDISAGVVRFEVVEAQLDEITVTGTEYFSPDNIRRSLPSLTRGALPNAVRTAENLALANENPAKQAEVLLKLSEKQGFVDAEIKVEDSRPTQFVAGFDNTGRGSSGGDYRLALSLRHANLFDRDHIGTLQYTTDPQNVSDVTVLGFGYRVPLYSLGDSVDLFGGYSNIDAGTLGGGGIDRFVGRGQIAGLRYHHHLPRIGEYNHSLQYQLLWKSFDNSCTGPACVALGSDVTAAPVGVSYIGRWTRPGSQSSLNVAYEVNTGLGSANNRDNYDNATHQPGTIGATYRFQVGRLAASHLQILPADFQARVHFNGQYTQDSLISGEQLGLAGNHQVRGFYEREAARDRGYVMNFEVYSPDLSKKFSLPVKQLRALAFVDHGYGSFVTNSSEISSASETLASLGAGLRMAANEHLAFRLDVARVASGAGRQKAGDWAGHFLLQMMY